MVVHQVNKGVIKVWAKEKDFGRDFISYIKLLFTLLKVIEM